MPVSVDDDDVDVNGDANDNSSERSAAFAVDGDVAAIRLLFVGMGELIDVIPDVDVLNGCAFDGFRCLSYVECVNFVSNDERSEFTGSLFFRNELGSRLNGSGLGRVGINATRAAPTTLGARDTLTGLSSFTGSEFNTGGLLVTAFFLNSGVNRRCSSRRSIITGCITDDKYERL